MGGSADVGGGRDVRAVNASQGDFPCERSCTSPVAKQGKRAKRARSGGEAAEKIGGFSGVSTQSRERPTGPLRATTITGLSRDRVIDVQRGQETHRSCLMNLWIARRNCQSGFFAKEFFHHDAVSCGFTRVYPGFQNRSSGKFLRWYHSS